jgi:hypothetical protein
MELSELPLYWEEGLRALHRCALVIQRLHQAQSSFDNLNDG